MKTRLRKLGNLGSECGFSVIETLIAMAVLAIVSFGFMGWVDMSYRNLDNINENNEIANAMTRLRASFGDDDVACTAMLAGKSFSSPISYIPYYDVVNKTVYPPSDVSHHVLDTAANAGLNGKQGVHVASITLESAAKLGDYYPPKVQAVKPGPQVHIANLVVKFEKTKNTGPDIVRKIPLYTLYGSGSVVRCSPSPISEASTALRACSLKKDGKGYISVNPTTGAVTCVDYPSLKWIPGTSQSASCTQGVVAAKIPPQGSGIASQGAKFACRVSTANGFNIPPRYYANNLVDSGNSIPAQADLTPAGVCVFDYQAGADSSTYQGQIYCDLNP